MKKFIFTSLLVAAALRLPAQTTNTYFGTSATIPDGSPVGAAQSFAVSGLSGVVADIQVNLDITGGFNGDLYAYLAGPQGQLAILLNRPGITGLNPFGYSDAGMNLTLDGQATNNIHDYASVAGYSLTGTTWAADGRNIDPQSAGSVFDTAATTANLGIFENGNPNGAWTFFIADLSAGGGTANLVDISISIVTVVPEPQTWVLLGAGMLMLAVARLAHHQPLRPVLAATSGRSQRGQR